MNIEQLDFFLKHTRQQKSVLLLGDSGLGKSSYIAEFARKIGYQLIDLRLGELEPTDITGMPMKEQLADGTWITTYARPHWWPTDGKFVLSIEEIDRCRKEMHGVAMQLVQDRRAGQRNLPDGGYIFAAGNGEGYQTIPIDQALMRRFGVVQFTPTVAEWITWANKNNINKMIVDFITACNNLLDTPEALVGKPNVVAPTRSGWAELGLWLNEAAPNSYEGINMYAEPFVGFDAACIFEDWAVKQYKPISANDVFANNTEKKIASYMQASAIADDVALVFMLKSKDEQYNALKYFMDAGEEIFAAFFRALPRSASSVIRQYKDVDAFIMEKLFIALEKTPDWSSANNAK